MKFLLILLISATILSSIAEAASSQNTNRSPASYRNARKTSNRYKELVDLMNDEENDEDELDDEDDDDGDEDDDNDLDDESDGGDNFSGNRFPQFHELFPNPDGRPAGPNSYDAYIKHMPKAQQQQQSQRQPQQGYSHGHPPPSPVRRQEQGPVYDDDGPPPPPPPRRRKISSKKSKRNKKRPSHDYDDVPPPRGPPPPGYYDDAPPPQGPPPPGYYDDAPPPQGPPPPGYYDDAPPPKYYDDAPSQNQHHQGRPINFQSHQSHGPPPKQQQQHQSQGHNSNSGFQPGYPIVEALPQGGTGTQWFEFPPKIFKGLGSFGSLGSFGRSDLPTFSQQGVLSRRLLSESDEVSTVSSDSSAQVQPEQETPVPVVAIKVQEKSAKSKVTKPTLFNRPGHGSGVRPGFGTNRYYIPSSQETRYFRPITNRVYSDYSYVPQGAFIMDGYRPSYRPRYDTSVEQSPRQVYHQFVTVPVHGGHSNHARYYGPWSNQYVVNPKKVPSRRKYRYHQSSHNVPTPQHVPVYNGYWGNARNTYVHPWTGSYYHAN